MTPKLNRWKRFADWDERPLRLDKFAAEDPANGFSAFSSPADPKPAIGIEGGRVVSLDGVLEHDYDMIDRFIARHHIDPEIAPEAMAMDSAHRRALAGRHERAAREAGAACARHDAGEARRGRIAAQRAGDRLRLFEDAGAQDARQPGACHQRQGRSAAARRRRRDRRRLRLRRDRDDDAGVAQRLVQRGGLRGRRRGRPLGDAVPVLQRGSRGAAHRHGRLHLLRRDRLRLRHREILHRRRRHAMVEGLPRRRLRLARRQDALHVGRRLRAADGLP